MLWRDGAGRRNENGLRRDYHSLMERRGLGVNGLIKAFVGKKTFSGAYDEDLDDTLIIYDTLSDMCGVYIKQKRRAMPIMLSGDVI